MTVKKHGHFKSRIFMRLFLSYVMLIVAFFAVYTYSIIAKSRAVYTESVEQTFQQKSLALSNWIDLQLLGAQNIISSINNSETIKALFSRIFVEQKPVDSMMFYRVQVELKNFKASSNNLGIYSVLLNFKGEKKAYAAGEVIDFQGDAAVLPSTPYFGVNSVANLWNVTNTANIHMNKEYLIYGGSYYVTLNSSTKGSILVLFNKDATLTAIRSILEGFQGMQITYLGETVLTDGLCEGHSFAAQSALNKNLSFQVYIAPGTFVQPFTSAEFVPLFVALLIGLAFIVATYFISKHYYLPFGSIERIIDSDRPVAKNEIESILDGIRNLIGERNGYRERIVTITPYAKQGMLHSILTGDVQKERLRILIDEQYIDLKLPYFMLALANIAYKSDGDVAALYRDTISVIQHVCQAYSNEDTQIDCYKKDAQNVFIIANSNQDHAIENTFYALHKQLTKEIDDPRCEITLGVSLVENDLSRLSEACKDAELALERMLVGGRNSIYFYEKDAAAEAKAYYFPKDAVKRLARDFKEENRADLKAFLQELYTRNIRESDINPADIRLMIDELHIAALNALQSVSGVNTTRIQIERMQEVSTIDEVFVYYEAVFEEACRQLTQLMDSDQSVRELKEEIVAFMNERYLDPDLSLNSLADHFGVSTKYICLVCKECLNTTFLQYVREKQIRRAAELLKTTGESLETIAMQCGFTNMLTFRRNFKVIMGMNPSDYR